MISSLAGSCPADAQVTLGSTGAELGHVFEDVGYLWSSPLRASSREWMTVGLLSAGTAALLPVDVRVDRWIVANPRATLFDAVSPFRESTGALTRLATARQLVPISAALVLAGVITDRRELREAGYGCIAAWGASNTIRYTIYAGISRARPSSADGDALRIALPGGSWNEQSFFAGHATNAFACAAFWSERFDLSFAEPVLYVGAGLTALARMVDRRHWSSDTFVGTAVGLAIGRTIAARYERREARRNATRSQAAADITIHHATLAAPRTVVVLWRARF